MLTIYNTWKTLLPWGITHLYTLQMEHWRAWLYRLLSAPLRPRLLMRESCPTVHNEQPSNWWETEKAEQRFHCLQREPPRAFHWKQRVCPGLRIRHMTRENWRRVTLLLLLLSHVSRVWLCVTHRRQPTRLPVPGILQARTLEWVAISFSNAWKWKVKGKSLSRVQLLATPWTAAYQVPPSMGFSRQEYWSGVPLPSPQSHTDQAWMPGPLCQPRGVGWGRRWEGGSQGGETCIPTPDSCWGLTENNKIP